MSLRKIDDLNFEREFAASVAQSRCYALLYDITECDMCKCFNCESELEEIHDTTYSNIETERCSVGQHTGDIYYCENCELMTIDCFLSGRQRQWVY